MTRTLAALALVLTVAACGKNEINNGTVSRNSNIITREEIAGTTVESAYDAVQRLRPMFLRPRSTGSRSNALAVVFIDGVRRGDPEVLRAIAARSVEEIRFITAVDATTRYGTNIEGGVLQVTLVR
jgi:hypothetical protein